MSDAALMFRVGPVYRRNMELVKGGLYKTLVNQGGTSSAKTYSILQALFTIASEYIQTEAEPTCVITIVGQDIPNLKRGALRQALEIYNGSPVLKSLVEGYNKTDRVFTFHNGAIIEFNSYQDEQDAKSGKRDYLFINEANGVIYEVYWQLAIRTKHKVFLDYNPTARFWCHERVIGNDKARAFRIISDHRHNDFLTDDQHADIEAIKSYDFELWRVYARGATGKIEGLVFRNWEVLTGEVPTHARLIAYGMDFGFVNDPTTLVAVYEADGCLYLIELLYETGLTTDDIIKRFEELGIKKTAVIVADVADSKTIEEIKRKGYKYIEKSDKGPDSIINGIDILKRFQVYMTPGSMNLRKEQSSYKWATDKQTGLPINKPIDKLNHLMDAIRYVALNKISASKQHGKAKYTFRRK